MIGDIFQPTHLLFILVVALLVLGPKRLPEAGRALGKGIRDFRSAMSGDEDHQSAIPPQTPAAPAYQAPPAPAYQTAAAHPYEAPTAPAYQAAPPPTYQAAPPPNDHVTQATSQAAHAAVAPGHDGTPAPPAAETASADAAAQPPAEQPTETVHPFS
jgi:sec-independent protein translocase protein TatA